MVVRNKSRFKLAYEFRVHVWGIILQKELVKEGVELVKRGKLRRGEVLGARVKPFKACPHVMDIWGNGLGHFGIGLCLGCAGFLGQDIVHLVVTVAMVIEICHLVHIPYKVYLFGRDLGVREAGSEADIRLMQAQWVGLP